MLWVSVLIVFVCIRIGLGFCFYCIIKVESEEMKGVFSELYFRIVIIVIEDLIM